MNQNHGQNDNVQESSELDSYTSVNIEVKENLSEQKSLSILESLLFMSDRPVTMDRILEVFADTQVEEKDVQHLLTLLRQRYQSEGSGIYLEEVAGGYQIRTKLENQKYLVKQNKGRILRLSQPALEVLAIVAYKQPIIKAEIDEIRGVESGHLLRALMEKGLIKFGNKSDLPGKPMYYETTKKFLEVIGLRNIKELPSLSQIEELLPEGIDDVNNTANIKDVSDKEPMLVRQTYSEEEEELEVITLEIKNIEITPPSGLSEV
ncbi:MAG: SMC-Scp complex subunit ScpB [Bdellovibrionaceae bacterium]|nr:SMC-Scp complex subunit ScpB [Pseudobdellovibrionaceae bacterium]